MPRLLGAAATLTRAVGITLVIPMAITWIRTGEWMDLDLEWRQIFLAGHSLAHSGQGHPCLCAVDHFSDLEVFISGTGLRLHRNQLFRTAARSNWDLPFFLERSLQIHAHRQPGTHGLFPDRIHWPDHWDCHLYRLSEVLSGDRLV